jgi:UDP:flavonoid glycosyltransferase YjiC (YdhE family)
MSTIIFASDYGSGLGDLAAFLPVANVLRQRGWNVIFALAHASDALELAAHTLDAAGYEWFETAGAADKNTTTLAERIASVPSFVSAGVLGHDLAFWSERFRLLQPAVVVVGRAVLATVAATLAKIPCCALDTGRFHVHGSDARQSPERLACVRTATEHLLRTTRAALRLETGQPLRTLADLYRIDRVLRVAPRLLLDDSVAACNACVGGSTVAIPGPRIDWPQSDIARPRIFAYLKPQLANASAILEALSGYSSLNIIMSMPGVGARARKRFEREHLKLVNGVADVHTALTESDAVICHGGASMLAQALVLGKPLLLAPATQEQRQLAAAAVSHRVALQLQPDSSPALVRARLDQLLAGWFAPGCSYTACARALARKIEPADVDAIASSIEKSAGSRNPPGTRVRSRKSTVAFSDYDVIFLSYDEPNADQRWGALKRIATHAQRVHGVTGFDAAHKAAATASRSERFVLVDGDNLMDERFFRIRTRVPPLYADGVWQWCSVNNVTGLSYPFGGVKIWPRSQALSMRTHEACADPTAALATDFWAMPGYYTFRRAFSVNFTNGSAYQAFRAAFREGAKLVGWNGMVRTPADFVSIEGMPQSRRAVIWMSVGADVPNGMWSLLGARLGFLSYFDSNFDQTDIGAYTKFEAYWRTVFASIYGDDASAAQWGKGSGSIACEALDAAVARAGREIKARFGKPIAIDMTAEQSARFKQAMRAGLSNEVRLFKPFGLNDGF